MPRRVNPVILLGIIVVAVLSIGISAGAAPEDGAVLEKGVVPNEGTAPGGSPAPAGEGGVPEAPEGNIVPEGRPAFENATVSGDNAGQYKDDATPAEQEDTQEEKTTPLDQEEAAPEESLTREVAESKPVEGGTLEEEAEIGEAAEEAGQEFQERLDEAAEAQREYNEALLEEDQLNIEIAETYNDLKVVEDSLEEAQGSLEERASQIYMDGQNGGFLGILLGAENVQEFRDLLDLGVKLIEQEYEEVETWRESSDQLKQHKHKLEADLEDLEQTRQKAADRENVAETSVNGVQEFFVAQPDEIQQKIEEDRAREEDRALNHLSQLLEEATQEEPSLGEEEESDETAGDEQPSPETEEGSNDTVEDVQSSQTETGELERTPEKEKVVQAEVAQALTNTIEKWQAEKKPLAEAVEEPVKEPGVENTTNDNPAAKQLAAAEEEKAKAQDQAKEATEQVVAEKAAQEKAAEEAEKAKLAVQNAQNAPTAEKEPAQAAAEEAERKAKLAAEKAAGEKQAAEEAAKQATEKQSFAMELEDAAVQKAAEEGMLGLNPTSGASEGGVIGEAKEWLGVPYDYTHMGGISRRGVDCSAFTAAVYREFGITLPDNPVAQYGMGTPVIGEPKAGDLVFFNEHGDGISHVGISNGDGTLTHASDFTGEVSVTPMKYLTGYAGARRFL